MKFNVGSEHEPLPLRTLRLGASERQRRRWVRKGWPGSRRTTAALRAFRQHLADVICRAISARPWNLRGETSEFHVRQRLNLPTDLGERKMLLLEPTNEAQPVQVHRRVPGAPPGALRGWQQPLLHIEVNCPCRDAGQRRQRLQIECVHLAKLHYDMLTVKLIDLGQFSVYP